MQRRSFTVAFLYMNGGLIIWAARFVAAYGFAGVACSRGWDDAELLGIGIIPFGIALMTVVAVAGALVVFLHGVRRVRPADSASEEAQRPFIHQIAAMVAALGILAMIWETIPAFTVPVCT